MDNNTISLWKVEEFLLDNLKEIIDENNKIIIKSNCSLADFIVKFEEYIKK